MGIRKIESIQDILRDKVVPEVIYQELIRHGNERTFRSYRNDKGETVKEFGDLMAPFRYHFSRGEIDFYFLEKYYDFIERQLEKGELFDSKGVQLNRVSFEPYLMEYGKGFNSGYWDFEKEIKYEDNIFSLSDDKIAYNVFSRIWGFKENGSVRISFLKEDLIESIKEKMGVDFPWVLDKEGMFESGVSGGEFYRAWTIILQNPTIFEPIFLKHKKAPTQEDKGNSIDLSDTSATEKIIYLKNLGVLDFLKEQQPFISSTNSLASVLSAITGEKQTSIYPMINPMFNNGISQKNNPLNSTRTVEKVKFNLIEIGFNLDERN